MNSNYHNSPDQQQVSRHIDLRLEPNLVSLFWRVTGTAVGEVDSLNAHQYALGEKAASANVRWSRILAGSLSQTVWLFC